MPEIACAAAIRTCRCPSAAADEHALFWEPLAV
jgi:hypothetical protein